VPYLILRISNPYGPYQAAKNKGYGIINYFIQLALRGEPIRLFGDGSQIRDFVYVEDLMDILLCAIAAPACHNQIFNLGGRNPISLRATAEAIALAAGGTPVILEPLAAGLSSCRNWGLCKLQRQARALHRPCPSNLIRGRTSARNRGLPGTN
jgi:nucleoside-diphosphate-sugar epimerase